MADSLHEKILEQMRTDIRAIGLTGIRDDHIVILTNPDDYEKWLTGDRAGVLISPIGAGEQINSKSPGTNTADDIGYPVWVGIIDPTANEETDSERDRRLRWREQILDNMIHRRLTGAINYDIDVSPGPIVDLSAWFSRAKFLSTLQFVVTQRVTRRAS